MSGSFTNSHIEPFLDAVDDLFLFQHVCNPTRFRQDTTPSLLDLVFTNERDMVANLSHLPPLGNSDHVCIQFDVLCYSEYKNSDKTRYNIAAANIDMMKESLSSVEWSSILDPLNINDAWLLFKTTFQDIIDKHVPAYIPKERKNLYATPEVFILKKKKNKL